MKSDIQDQAVLKGVAYHDLLLVLHHLKWKQAWSQPGQVAVFRKESSGGEHEIKIPLDDTLLDYADSVKTAIRKLADAEGINQDQVLARIRSIGNDIVRVRAVHDSYQDGTIPLEAGAALFEASKSLLVSAALAANTPRAAFGGTRPKQVEEFIGAARLGQTEQGSYVVTMHTRIPPTLFSETEQGAFDMGEELAERPPSPFERKVTETLAKALKATKDALSESAATQSVEPFERAVQSGISANMLDSIVNLTELTGAVETDISIGWSPTREPEAGLVSEVRFTTSETSTLKEASRILREREPNEDFELEGMVIGLESEEPTVTGLIIVRAKVNGKWHKVRLQLPSDAYNLALTAHKAEYVVMCVGELRREGRQYTLANPRNFRWYNDEPPLPFVETDERSGEGSS